MSKKYSIRERSSSKNKIVLILDTSALLAKYHLYLPPDTVESIIPPRVYEEVKDRENREALELGVSIKRISIVEPPEKDLKEIIDKAKKIGEYKLSETDLEVAALALYYKSNNRKVVVITDDYSLQNLLANVEIPFKPLRTTGIKSVKKYRVYCPVCGYTGFDPGEEYCPICGAKLVRKTISRKPL